MWVIRSLEVAGWMETEPLDALKEAHAVMLKHVGEVE